MSVRLAAGMLEEPIEIVSRLSKTELLLLEELIKAGPNNYVEKKLRKTFYMLPIYNVPYNAFEKYLKLHYHRFVQGCTVEQRSL